MAIANKTSSKETGRQTDIPSHERDASSYRTLEPSRLRHAVSPERRCSSRTFRYGYLVTT